MTQTARQRRLLLDESRLLDDVLDLVQVWEGRPPQRVLDAVLRGERLALVPAQRCGHAS